MNMKYDKYKHCQGRSDVVPNQTKSIREILNRSMRGQYLAEVAANVLQYGEDDSLDSDLPVMEDKFDMLDHASYLEQRVAAYQAAVESEKARKQANGNVAEQSVATEPDSVDSAKND